MACQAVALIIISFVRSRFPDEVFLSVITVIVSDPVGPIRLLSSLSSHQISSDTQHWRHWESQRSGGRIIIMNDKADGMTRAVML